VIYRKWSYTLPFCTVTASVLIVHRKIRMYIDYIRYDNWIFSNWYSILHENKQQQKIYIVTICHICFTFIFLYFLWLNVGCCWREIFVLDFFFKFYLLKKHLFHIIQTIVTHIWWCFSLLQSKTAIIEVYPSEIHSDLFKNPCVFRNKFYHLSPVWVKAKCQVRVQMTMWQWTKLRVPRTLDTINKSCWKINLKKLNPDIPSFYHKLCWISFEHFKSKWYVYSTTNLLWFL